MPGWVFPGETRAVAEAVRISGGKFRIGKFPVQADTVRRLGQVIRLRRTIAREENSSVNCAQAEPIHFLSVKEVCRRRQCSRSTLYVDLQRRETSNEAVPMPRPFKLGRRTYFVASEVEVWLQAAVTNARNPV